MFWLSSEGPSLLRRRRSRYAFLVSLRTLRLPHGKEDDSEELGDETLEQRDVRLRAAALALIGCSIEELGWLDGDDVVVKLDAWFIGDALAAADMDGLLNN